MLLNNLIDCPKCGLKQIPTVMCSRCSHCFLDSVTRGQLIWCLTKIIDNFSDELSFIYQYGENDFEYNDLTTA